MINVEFSLEIEVSNEILLDFVDRVSFTLQTGVVRVTRKLEMPFPPSIGYEYFEERWNTGKILRVLVDTETMVHHAISNLNGFKIESKEVFTVFLKNMKKSGWDLSKLDEKMIKISESE